MPSSGISAESSISSYSAVSGFSKTKLYVSKAEAYWNQKNGDRFYKYGIHIRTNDPCFSLMHSLVRRRYSEFCWLKKYLRDIYYVHDVVVPDMPTQGLFKNRNDPKFLEERRLGLENFILKVLSTSIFTGSRGLHLFLQTSLTVEDIKYNLNGSRHDHVILIKKFTPIIDVTPPPPSPSDADLVLIGSAGEQKKNNAKLLASSPGSVTSTDYSSTPPRNSILKTVKSYERSLGKPSRRVSFNNQVRILTVSSAFPLHKFYED